MICTFTDGPQTKFRYVHPIDKAMSDLWSGTSGPQPKAHAKGKAKAKPKAKALYKEPKRRKTGLWMRLLDNAMRVATGRRLWMYKLTKYRVAEPMEQIRLGTLTLLWLLQFMPFLAFYMDKASEQHAGYCWLAWLPRIVCVRRSGLFRARLNRFSVYWGGVA
jgi:hypothetical protein